MCKPASFILTKDNVYWSLKTDSHEGIIKECKIRDQFGGNIPGENTSIIARVEITPKDCDMFSDPSTWVFCLDQDRAPEWWDADRDEKRARLALKDWVRSRVFVGGNHEVRDASVWVKDATVTACDSSTVTACDSSTVTAYRSSTVKAYDSSTVKAYDSSTVTAYDSSTVTACDSSTVTAYRSSTVTACDSSTVTAYGSSTVKACDSSTVMTFAKINITLSSNAVEIMRDKNGRPSFFVADKGNE